MNRLPRLILAWLASLPRTGVFLAALAVVLGGLFLPGLAGAVILVLLVAGLAAVLTVTWPRLPAPARGLRLLVLLVLLTFAAVKLS